MTNRQADAAATMREAARAHMQALQTAFAAGVPAADIEHSAAMFTTSARTLVTVCTMPTGRAPMNLGSVA